MIIAMTELLSVASIVLLQPCAIAYCLRTKMNAISSLLLLLVDFWSTARLSDLQKMKPMQPAMKQLSTVIYRPDC